MSIQPLIESIREEMKSRFAGEGTGHDWAHMERVWRNAVVIAKAEGANAEVVALGALLHDIADHKFHNGSLSEGPRQAREAIMQRGGDPELADKVATIVAEVSFKGAGVPTPVSSLEAAVVQDADRLDAIGAIGVARAFAYGGSKGRALHSPGSKPLAHDDFQSYANDEGATINHFYEKLLLLQDRMHTATGKAMAAERHAFMEAFLAQFLKEWQGEDF
jgi:uncharacterized protein